MKYLPITNKYIEVNTWGAPAYDFYSRVWNISQPSKGSVRVREAYE